MMLGPCMIRSATEYYPNQTHVPVPVNRSTSQRVTVSLYLLLRNADLNTGA